METISELMKKIMLAGIGAVAVTAEKSKDLLDDLVQKGELTVEQGKVLNEELKHTVKETIQKKVNPSSSPDELLKSMTPEQIQQLKELLQNQERPDTDSPEDTPETETKNTEDQDKNDERDSE